MTSPPRNELLASLEAAEVAVAEEADAREERASETVRMMLFSIFWVTFIRNCEFTDLSFIFFLGCFNFLLLVLYILDKYISRYGVRCRKEIFVICCFAV